MILRSKGNNNALIRRIFFLLIHRLVCGSAFLPVQVQLQLQLQLTRSTIMSTYPCPTSPTTTYRMNVASDDDSVISSLVSDDRMGIEFVPGQSIEDIHQSLLQRGLQYTQTTSLSNHPEYKVPGCVANVYLQVTIQRDRKDDDVDDDNNNNNNNKNHNTVEDLYQSRVTINGMADALISRGLVAVLTQVLEQLHVQTILQLHPNTMAQQLHLSSALSPGRNDGIANMVKLIQQQLRDQLHIPNRNNNNNNNNHHHHNHNINDNRSIPDAIPDELQSSRPSTHSIRSGTTTSQTKKPTVALLLSGGVDSSVALHLLLQQGYDVTPFYLKIWLEDELSHLGICPWEDDVRMCQQVCQQAGVELQTLSLQTDYQQHVLSTVLREAAMGRTPNPDILCNSRVKFGCFVQHITKLEQQQQQGRTFDRIASGHYAQVRYDDITQQQRLFRAPDPVKDQSYFLCALTQQQLRRLIFPIGHLDKSQVRQLAEDYQLPNRKRPDSQGLCFLGKLKFADFLEVQLGQDPGDIVDAVSGEIIGRHDGVWYHTVGQRKGLGPSLTPRATSRGPWYVVAKDPSRKIVYASNQYDEIMFEQARSVVHVEQLHWIADIPQPDQVHTTFQMKIRHGPKLVSGTLELLDDPKEGIVRLNVKDGGLAPGQYVVFYNDQAECLGGGIISERHWAQFILESFPSVTTAKTNSTTAGMANGCDAQINTTTIAVK